MAFAGLSASEKERTRDELDRVAANYAALLNNRRDSVKAFRCVCAYGPGLSEGTATLDRWIKFAERALLNPAPPGESTLASDDVLHDDTSGAMVAGASPAEAEAMHQKLVAQRERDAQEQAAAVQPPWRETSGPQWGKFNRQLATVGSGLARRTLQSTAAVTNMIAALAPLNTDELPDRALRDNEMVSNPVVLSREDMETAFLFATRGADTLSFHEFVVLEHAVAAARYPHNYRDDTSAAVKRLHADYFRNCIEELCPASFDDINRRGPIVRFPDVNDVLFMHRRCIASVLELFSGTNARSIDVADILRLCDGVGAFEAPHMTPAAAKQCLCAALRVPLSALPQSLTRDQFIDTLCFLAFYLYSFEPHRSTLSTVAARVYAFLQSWAEWYERTLSEPLIDTLVPLPTGPAQLTGFSTTTVNARLSHVVDVYGRNFGNDGVFVRFGRLVTAAPRCTETQATVHVPPASTDKITVRLRTDGDDFIVQVVNYAEVDVTVSRDGHHFSAPCPTKFVYEDALNEVPVVAFQPKLLRIYQNYCRQGAAKAALDTSTAAVMKEAQWKKVLGEFHLVRSAAGETLIEPTAEELASESYQAELARMSTEERREMEDERAIGRLFREYATDATGRVTEKASADGPPPKAAEEGEAAKIKTLNFDRFVRALVHATVISRGTDVVAGLRVILASDKWVGRELLDDIPAAHKGDLALRIRRAANSFQLVKVMEHMSHNNSPREGVWSIPAIKREISHLPAGRWANEHDLDAMTLDFLANQRSDDDERFQAIADALRPIHDFEAPRVAGPPIDPTVDPPAVRHSDLAVHPDAFIPGLRAEAAPTMQQQLSPVPTDSVVVPAHDGPETPAPGALPGLTIDTADVTPAIASPAGASPAVELLPTKARTPAAKSPGGKASRRQSRRGSLSPHGVDPASMSGTVFTFQATKLTPAEERAASVRKLAKNLTVHAQRHELLRTQRHASTKADRHKREMERLAAKLDEERRRREEAESKLAEATRYTVPAEDLAFQSHPTVLRAEKEALQKEFVRQVERKKNKLESDMAHVEIMRDLERDRVVSELKEKMSNADFMYRRLQDTVRGQAESIKREAELIGVLRTRVSLLLEDSRFFRDTHEQLLTAVDKAKNKELLENLDAARHEHEIVMVELTQQLATEARNEGRRAQKSLKDNMPKRKPNQPMPDDAESVLRDAAAQRNVFDVGDGPTLVATFTEEEVAEEKAKAVDAAVEKYVAELADMDRQLSAANESFEMQLREAVTKLQTENATTQQRVEELEGRELAQQEESVEMAARLQALTEEIEQYKSKLAELEEAGDGHTPSRRHGRRRSRRSRTYSIAGTISAEASSAGLLDATQTAHDDEDGTVTDSARGSSTAHTPLTLQLQSASPAASLLVTPKRGEGDSTESAPHVTMGDDADAAADGGTPAERGERSERRKSKSRRRSSAKHSPSHSRSQSVVEGAETAEARSSGSSAQEQSGEEDHGQGGEGTVVEGDMSASSSRRSDKQKSRRASRRRSEAPKHDEAVSERADSEHGEDSGETSLNQTRRSDKHVEWTADPPSELADGDEAPGSARSQRVKDASSSRRQSTSTKGPKRPPRPEVAVEDGEAQTDLQADDVLSADEDEDLAWVTQFGKLRNTERVDHIEHALNEGDTVEGIAAAYGVPIVDVLTANFIAAPAEPLEAMADADLAAALDEMNIALRGIPSRRIVVPVPLGMKTEIAEMVAASHDAGAPLVLESSMRRKEELAAMATEVADHEAPVASSVSHDAVPPAGDLATAPASACGTSMPPTPSRAAAPAHTAEDTDAPAEAPASPSRVVEDLPQRASALAAVAGTLKEELGALRSLVSEMPKNALAAVLGETDAPWESQLDTLVKQLQPPPRAVSQKSPGLKHKTTSRILKPARAKPAGSSEASILAAVASAGAATEETPPTRAQADAEDTPEETAPPRLAESGTYPSIARFESVVTPSAGFDSPKQTPMKIVSSQPNSPAPSHVTPPIQAPDVRSEASEEQAASSKREASSEAASTAHGDGVSPPVAALLPTAVKRASTADIAERAKSEDDVVDVPAPEAPAPAEKPTVGPRLEFDVSEKVRPFGALKPQRVLKTVPIYPEASDDVPQPRSGPPLRKIIVWSESAGPEAAAAAASPTPDAAKPSAPRHAALVLSGAGAAPGSLPLKATGPAKAAYSVPMPLRERGQSLPHAGLGGALLMAEKHSRLQIVLAAEHAMEAAVRDFVHRLELLARGTVTTGSKPRSSKNAAAPEAPLEPTAAAMRKIAHTQARVDEQYETRLAVQARRDEARTRQETMKQIRGDTLEQRATAAVRQKRMLNERVKQRRAEEAKLPKLRQQQRLEAQAASPSVQTPKRSELPTLAQTPPPGPVSTASVAVGPNPVSSSTQRQQRQAVLPPTALTPEPKPSFPGAVRRQIAQVAEVDERLRLAREKKALDELLSSRHATAEARRRASDNAAYRGGPLLHPDLSDALDAVRPSFAKVAPASRSAPAATGEWSRHAKTKPLRVPPLGR